MSDYSGSYTEKSFWAKMASLLKKASRELIMAALILYYTAQRPETPVWAKSVIYATLGYLILPIDMVPDFLPGGLADDFGMLATALSTVALHITPETKSEAEATLRGWFGSSREQSA